MLLFDKKCSLFLTKLLIEKPKMAKKLVYFTNKIKKILEKTLQDYLTKFKKLIYPIHSLN